jgi:predicted GNAT family N-acyltransferase
MSDFSQVFLKKTTDLTPSETSQLIDLVKQGNQNNPDNIAIKLKAAEFHGFIKNNDVIVGMICVKKPGDEIVKSIFNRANSPHNPLSFKHELGFWVTDSAYRKQGLFKKIMSELLTVYHTENLFSIVHHPSVITYMGNQYGFVKSGVPFNSKFNGMPFQLIIRKVK